MNSGHRFDAFGSYHPAIPFALLAFAIVASVMVQHPAFLAASLACAASYYLTLRGREALGPIFALVPLFALVSLVNPVFNTAGDTVLFTYLGGRPYTLEALAYGMATAAMIASALLWFACFNAVMTGDAVAYLLGPFAPALSLAFTMVLRLVPLYQRKAAQIVRARSCIGKAPEGGLRNRVVAGAAVLSSLSSQAFEGAVVTADSMRSRGYGTARRTTYARYRFERRDALLAVVLGALAAVFAVSAMQGACGCEFVPTILIPEATPLFAVGLSAFAVLLLAPTAVSIGERVAWRISLSRI